MVGENGAVTGMIWGALSNCPGDCGLIGSIDRVRIYGKAVIWREYRKNILGRTRTMLGEK